MSTAMTRWVAMGVVMVAGAAFAQPKTLKEAVELTAKQNVDQQIAAQARARAAAEYDQAWMSLFPALTAQGSWTHNQVEVAVSLPTGPTTVKKLVITPADQLDGIARVDLPLVDTGRWMRISASAQLREAAVQREGASLNAVLRQVLSSWYGYAASLALLDSAKRSAQVAEEQAKLTEIREGAGVATGLDTLRSKAEVQRTRQVVADTTTLVAVSRRTLTTLVGSPPPDAVPLPEANLAPERPYLELEPNIETLPSVKAADFDAAAAGKVETASQLALVPLITANFTERLTNATGFSGRVGQYTAGIGFVWRLDVPTFQQMKVSRISHEVTLLAAERARLSAKDVLYSDWQKLDAARFKVDAADAQVEAARRAAQVAKDRFAAGAGTQFDVMQSERDYFFAEVNQIQAKTELASYRGLLHLSANLPLFD